MKLTYIGHSAFALEVNEHRLLIDPFITGNPVAVQDASDFAPTHIFVTHGHGDHWGDTEALAKEHDALIVSSAEIADYAAARDLNAHGMNIGGGFDFPFGRATVTPAWHSNSLPDGTYAGMPMGFVFEFAGLTLYHAGDTALFSDMALIADMGIDVALLPIGDNYTMGPAQAAKAAQLLRAKMVIPMHYATFPVLVQRADEFVESLPAGVRATVMNPGETVTLRHILTQS